MPPILLVDRPRSLITEPIEDATRREFITGVGAAALAAAFLAACGEDDDLEATPTATPEATTRMFEHLGGTTEIPLHPQRIVTLSDQNALLPLLELGVRPIASAGVDDGAGGHVYRRTEDFDTSDVAFVGDYGEPDLELISSQRPDLIVGYDGNLEIYDTLTTIAPTVLLSVSDQPLHQALRVFADAVGALDRWNELKAEYDAAVEAFIADLPRPAEEITVSVLYANSGPGTIWPSQGYHSVGTALQDSTLGRPPAETGLDGSVEYSIEELHQHGDADVMLLAYFEDTPEADANYLAVAESPIAVGLDVFQRGEVHPFNANTVTGSSFEKMHAFLDLLRSILIDRPVQFHS